MTNTTTGTKGLLHFGISFERVYGDAFGLHGRVTEVAYFDSRSEAMAELKLRHSLGLIGQGLATPTHPVQGQRYEVVVPFDVVTRSHAEVSR